MRNLLFDSWTLAMAQSNQDRTDDPRRVELKKFDKYDGKGDFEG